ncbi:MAG: hypothetical protein ACP5FL_02505, partial [Thermoplasmatota archaeon]
MYLNRKTFGALIALFVMVVPAAMTMTPHDVGESTGITEGGSDVGTAAYNPDNVTVVVDIMRLRAMTLEADTPRLYFKIFINGENAVWWEEIHEGPDIYFEWPTAAMNVPYNPDEPVTVQIEVWEKRRLGIDQPCDISRGTSDQLAGKTLTLFYDMKRGEWTGDDFLK